ncbi:MAG: helix-turn-helix transcriptional regulator [Candidatus Tyrphobacter sp.]
MVVGQIRCPELIGRSGELHELLERRLEASKRHGALVLVTGEGGMGKSRLVDAFRGEIAGRKTRFGIGYCHQRGDAPYAPLIEALRAAGFDIETPRASSRAEQLAALAASIAAACARRSAVLVIEDAQWADDATLGSVEHLLPLLRALPLLLVVTYRTDVRLDPHSGSSLARLARRCVSEISLGPLTQAEMRRLLRLEIAQQSRVGAEQLDEIIERADGNPFFAEELLRSAVARARSGRADSLPLTIRGAVAERLGELDARMIDIVQYASVLGRYIEAPLLGILCRQPAADTLRVLRRMRELQIVVEVPGSSERFAFRHELVRDAIYEGLLAQEAQPLHARILRLLESRPGSSAYDLAYHAWAAADAERCVFYNERAGDEAAAVHAYADAARAYERAAGSASMQAVRVRLLMKAAEVYARDGKANRSCDFYAQAAEVHAVTDLALLAELRCAMAVQARLAGDNERAVAILTGALEDVGDSNPRVRAELALHLAVCRLDHADAHGAAVSIAQSAQHASPALHWRVAGYAAAVSGDLDAMREASARAIAETLAMGEAATMRSRFNLGFYLCALGADDEALAVFNKILPDLRAQHLPSLEVLACANAALIHVRRADFASARESIERGSLVPEPSTTGPIALAAAALSLESFTAETTFVGGTLATEVADAAFHSNIDSALGRFAGPYARRLHSMGRGEEARGVLARALRLLNGPFGTTETLVAAAELADDSTASRALELAANAEHTPPIYAATIAHVRALLARRRQAAGTAVYAEEARHWYERLGWPLHAARCAELAGQVHASRTYRKLGATGETRRTIALSAREMEIASMVADGCSNKLVASRFNVTLRTVEKHLTSIYSKLGLRNRAELVAIITRTHASAEPP